MREGYGASLLRNGSKYEGYFLDDLFHGKGKFTYDNGKEYTGDFYQGKAHGSGVFIDI